MPHRAVDDLDDRSVRMVLPPRRGHLTWEFAFQVMMDDIDLDIGCLFVRHK
jgi:hypothetical protein